MAYPVIQQRGINLEPEVELLFLLAVNLFNGPLLELV
jgi:hypothetical protein